MVRYYFAATALPPLSLETPPELHFDAVMFILQVNLRAADLAAVQVLRRFYDIQNARALWLGFVHEPYGNLDRYALEEAIHKKEGLPDYVIDFLERYQTTEQRLSHFPALLAAYYRCESAKAKGFLRHYLTFEHQWRLVMTALRAKELGRSLAAELQYEDPYDDFIAQLLIQKETSTLEPPEGYKDLKFLFEEHREDPMALHRALCQYRFEKIEELLGVDLFTIDRILGYVAQLITVEQWFLLDRQAGMKVVDAIAKESL